MSSKFRHRVSLALNLVLTITALVLVFPRSERAASTHTQTPDESTMAVKPVNQYQAPRFSETASPSDQRRWLVDELRAMGVPNKVLARIVLADLDGRWNQHATEVTLKCRGDSDTMAALQLEIDTSRDADMRAALGDAGFRQWDQQNMLREANQGKIQLTAAETDTAYDLWKKMEQRELDLKQAQLAGRLDKADVEEAQTAAHAEYNQKLKTLLGDERYAKSQQTDDGSAAAGLRQDFAKADPSDVQFQQLLQTQQQWNERRADLDKQFQNDQESAEYTSQIKALDGARDAEYQSVLGTNVFSALQKEGDPGYSQMKKFESLWGLDDSSVDSVYSTLKYYEKSVSDYQNQARALQAQDQAVDWNAINKNLQQFTAQTQQSLQNYLGPDRYHRLQQNGVFQFNQDQFSYNKH